MAETTNSTFTIHTSLLFSPTHKTFLKNISLTISKSTGLITKIHTRTSPPHTPITHPDLDLRHLTLLPGLVDAHTHIFLHAYAETPSLNQMRDESLTERTIRAVSHCRTALLAGYTTYRDLGTEGAYDNDVHVRDAINRGLMPGPRIFCATECLTSSGGYELRIESRGTPGLSVPRISDPCDGVEGCRAAVRRRLGAGADVIKFYADYRKRELRFPRPQWPGCPEIAFPPGVGDGRGEKGRIGDERNPNLLLFTEEEMRAIVGEGKRARAPVAAHASSPEAVILAAKAGATTVEHGFMRSQEAVVAMRENGTIFVPTLAIVELYADDMGPPLAQTKAAFDEGVKLATGGDTGAFPHGENVRELELIAEAGVPLEEVLTAATLHGWEACGGDWCGRRFGAIEEGWAADLVGVAGDLQNDISSLRVVDFVMKDGQVWKQDGKAVGIV
ncbi:amidohydrolase-like protein 4 [Elsinoe australis]|uniref:Amidohydrolase-like protein 4 n=1 Tax=Elsinoe australis TaxID=40998 RepID=A0A4U7ATM2_9PEZI|nr:amidohydrolase-like protein 4 [Elsinoe australis]